MTRESRPERSKDGSHYSDRILLRPDRSAFGVSSIWHKAKPQVPSLAKSRDTTSAVVPGATVTIANPETGLRRSAKTDDAGRFDFPQFPPGNYSSS